MPGTQVLHTGQSAEFVDPTPGMLEVFNARMQRDSAVQISLQRYKGKTIGVKDEFVILPLAGFTRLAADHTIDGTGADTGVALALDTEYFVYVSNSKAAFSSLSIRCSLVAPSLVDGVKYLGVAGDALNWRFVGRVGTFNNGVGAPNFWDQAGGGTTKGKRLVVNYYNRLKKSIGFICQNYVNDNAKTTQALGAGPVAWTQLPGGVQSDFLSNGEDDIDLSYQTSAIISVGSIGGVGIQLDAANSPVVEGRIVNSVSEEAVSGDQKVSVAEGHHTIFLVFSVQGGGTLTITVDDLRNGAAADPMVTGYSASIMV